MLNWLNKQSYAAITALIIFLRGVPSSTKWKITKIRKERSGFTLVYNAHGRQIEHLLDGDAHWALAQLTKYEFKKFDGRNADGFRILRKLGLIVLNFDLTVVEPILLSGAGIKLSNALADFQYTAPGVETMINPPILVG